MTQGSDMTQVGSMTSSSCRKSWAGVAAGGLLAGLFTLLLTLLMLNLLLGAADLSLSQILATLSDADGAQVHAVRVVWELRLPRALIALLVGAQLTLAGLLLQTLTRNPLADAGILGISAGASLGAVLCLVLAAQVLDSVGHYARGLSQMHWLPLAAFGGGLISALLVYRLSGSGAMTPLRLILTGVICAAVLNALVTGVLGLWGQAHTEIIVAWLAGSLHARGWEHLWVLLPWSLTGLLAVSLMLRPLGLLLLADDQVYSLGLHLARWRLIAILLATVLAASAVAVAGPIGFVGLVVPHMARSLAPANLPLQAVLSALLGALVLLTGDLAGRVLLAPYELPVGVLAALIGVPVFLYLLRRQT